MNRIRIGKWACWIYAVVCALSALVDYMFVASDTSEIKWGLLKNSAVFGFIGVAIHFAYLEPKQKNKSKHSSR